MNEADIGNVRGSANTQGINPEATRLTDKPRSNILIEYVNKMIELRIKTSRIMIFMNIIKTKHVRAELDGMQNGVTRHERAP